MQTPDTNLRRILFVDDERAFLDMVGLAFGAWSKGEWQVLTADNAGRALSLLQEQKIDLVVIDLQMPVVDGVQFLSLLHRKHPGLSKAVLSGFLGESQRATALAQGADLFLEKPRNQAGLESVFSMLNELGRMQRDAGFRGVLRQVGLQDIIQMECLSRHSVVLEITDSRATARIFVHEGDIVHAELEGATGEAAFNAILKLTGGEFKLKPWVDPGVRTIDGQWEFLLMEAARLSDEAIQTASDIAAKAEDERAGAWEEYTPESAERTPSPTSAPRRRPRVEDPTPPGVDEMLICNTRGDLLYEWQSKNAETRITLLEFLQQKSRQLTLGLPLGAVRRFGSAAEGGRMVALLGAERTTLITTSRATKTG